MDEQIPYIPDDTLSDSLVNKLKRTTTSFSLLVAAFIVANSLLKALIALFSWLLKYKVRFAYSEVLVTPSDYHYWNRSKIIVTTLFPPVICLIAGVVIFNFLRKNSEWSSRWRIFFFWLSVTLVNLVITHILVAPIASPYNHENGLYQTFAITYAWFFVDPALMGMASIASIFASLGVGMLLRNEIMRYSFSKKLISSKDGMDSIVLQIYLLPVVLAAAPLLLLCLRINFFTTIMEFINLGIIAMGVFAANSVWMSTTRCQKRDVLNRLPLPELIITTSLWLAIFFFLR
jgi:hypothetical protein